MLIIFLFSPSLSRSSSRPGPSTSTAPSSQQYQAFTPSYQTYSHPNSNLQAISENTFYPEFYNNYQPLSFNDNPLMPEDDILNFDSQQPSQDPFFGNVPQSNEGGLFHQSSFEQSVFTPQDQFAPPFSIPPFQQFEPEPMDQFSPFSQQQFTPVAVEMQQSEQQQQTPIDYQPLQSNFNRQQVNFEQQQPYSVQYNDPLCTAEEFASVYGNLPAHHADFYERTWRDQSMKTPDNLVINGENLEIRESMRNQASDNLGKNVSAAAQQKRKTAAKKLINNDFNNVQNNENAVSATTTSNTNNATILATNTVSTAPSDKNEEISLKEKQETDKPKGFTPAELARLAQVTQDISQKLQNKMQNDCIYWDNTNYNANQAFAVNPVMQQRFTTSSTPANVRPLQYPQLQPPLSHSSHIRPPPIRASQFNSSSVYSPTTMISDEGHTNAENTILSQLLEEQVSPVKQPPLSHYERHKDMYAMKLGIPTDNNINDKNVEDSQGVNPNPPGASQILMRKSNSIVAKPESAVYNHYKQVLNASRGDRRRSSNAEASDILRLDLNKPGPCNKDIVSEISSPRNINLPGSNGQFRDLRMAGSRGQYSDLSNVPGPSGSGQTSNSRAGRNKKTAQDPDITMSEIIAQLSENDPDFNIYSSNAASKGKVGQSSATSMVEQQKRNNYQASARFLPQVPSYSNRPIAEHYIIPPAPPGPQRILRFIRPERPGPRPRPPPPSYEVPLTYPTHTHIPPHYSPNSVVTNGEMKHMENAEFDRLPPSYIQQPAQIPHLMPRDPVPRFSNNSSMYSAEQNARLHEIFRTAHQINQARNAMENAHPNRPHFPSVIPPLQVPDTTPPCDFPVARARFGVQRKGLDNALRDANDNVVNPAGLNFLSVSPLEAIRAHYNMLITVGYPDYVMGYDKFKKPEPYTNLSMQIKPAFWCTIDYYEADQKIGDSFQAPHNYPNVSIDGGVNPSAPNRFCLGSLSSIRRERVSERVLRAIRTGVVLRLKNEGDVWLTNTTGFPIFAQSFHLDIQAFRAIFDEPHRFEPGTTVKLFDLRQVRDEILQRNAFRRYWDHIKRGTASIESLTHDVEKMKLYASKNTGVDDLRRLCTVRISFVKGFGLAYERSTIERCPCWVEIRITRALQILDEVLQQ
jgi:hypothetical protein